MNTAYEYITFAGNSGYLWQVFNAIATLMGSGGFESLIMATTMLGFIFVVGVGAFKLDLKPFTMWFFGLVFLWYGFMIPKVDVMIVDRTNTQGPMVVSNVPLGFAMPASYVSQVGDYLTTSMESLFSLPNDLQYSENGMLFGSRMYQNLSKSVLADRVLQSDWAAFMNNCTLYDIVLYNFISAEEFRESTTLIETLGKTNQALFVNISKGTQTTNALGLPTMKYGTGKDMMYCNLAYVELKKRTEMDTRAQMFKLAKITDQTGSNTNLTDQYNKFVGGLDATYSTFLGGISKNAMDSVMQHTMINVLKEGEIQNATNNGNNERLGSALAAAQAEQATLLSMKAGGMTASTMLPMIKNVIEGVIISLFPIAVMCAFLALGAMWNVLQAYFMALIWIQLWPPLFAIMNLAMTAQTRNNVAGFVNQFSGDVGVSLANSSEILKEFAAMENIASGMLWSIPVIAGAIVQGMKSLAGASLMGMAKGAESASSSAAGAIASGNINIGNVQSGNQNSNKRDTSQSYNSGQVAFKSGNAGSMIVTPGSQGINIERSPFKAQTTEGKANTLSWMSTQAEQSAQGQMATAAKMLSQASGRAYQYVNSAGKNDSLSKAITSQMGDSQKQAYQQLNQIAESVSQTGVMTKAEAFKSMVSGKVDASVGVKAFGTGLSMSASNTRSAEKSKTIQDVISEGNSILKQSGASFSADQMKAITTSDAFQSQKQLGNSEANTISEAYNESKSATLAATDSYQKSNTYAKAAAEARTTGGSISSDLSAEVDSFLANNPDLLSKIIGNPRAIQGEVASATGVLDTGKPSPENTVSNTTGATHAQNASNIKPTVTQVDPKTAEEVANGGQVLSNNAQKFTLETGERITNGSEKISSQPQIKKPHPPTHGPVSKGVTGFPSKISNKVGRKWETLAKGNSLEDLAKVISLGEGHYHSVNLGEKHGGASSTRNLSEMTVGEIMQRQANREFNAVGRYQMIRGTFAEGVQKLGISKNAKFTPELQDKMYREYLIPKAGGGAITRYLKGKGSKQDAMIGAAMEWRSIADPTTGKTYADGGAKGNKASIPSFVIGGILENIKNNQ